MKCANETVTIELKNGTSKPSLVYICAYKFNLDCHDSNG